MTKDDDKFHGGELRDDKLVELQRPKRSQMIGIWQELWSVVVLREYCQIPIFIVSVWCVLSNHMGWNEIDKSDKLKWWNETRQWGGQI